MTQTLHSREGLARQARPVAWTREHVEAIAQQPGAFAPRIRTAEIKRVAHDLDVWDAWPIQETGGAPIVLDDRSTLWMALAAPRDADPDKRHGRARIHLFQRSAGEWRHLGPAMPDGFSPGSREWSGSAVRDASTGNVTLFFTATGRRGEQELTFEQRMFSACATLDVRAAPPRLADWRDLHEIVHLDRNFYMPSDSGTGAIGTIKAFRDPFFFQDPAGGASYLFFAASEAHSKSNFNGVIGAARGDRGGSSPWRVLPPVMTADGLNNELERPHVVFNAGRYYLFWSTQRHVFDSAGPTGPTGLYGMVGASLAGPWQPLNGTGLVFANPPEAPSQAYSWLVLPSLEVISFVDDWRAGEGGSGRSFGATFAPVLHLALDPDGARLRP